MTAPASDAQAGPPPRSAIWAAVLIVLAALAAYANSFQGPFIFDDIPSIPDNPTLRRLATVLSPPEGHGHTVSGRPLLNLSFALNDAISGTQVWSYHATNLLIHVLAGLALFGLVRRSCSLPYCPKTAATSGDAAASRLALAVALLWTVHPLQTESVTYVVQRAESLMGLFYLLTLYCFVRGAGLTAEPHTEGTKQPRASLRVLYGATSWYALSVLACLCGMATKEVMVSAPVVVWLLDRTFVAGSFREAWRRRRGLYLALASTWMLLIWLVLGTGSRGGTAGFGVGIGWWQYAATQFEAATRYLQLSLWPHPLIIDYGVEWVKAAGDFIPQAALVAMAAGTTIAGLLRRKAAGFLGFWFFAILAPTSLVPGTRQTIAEHRMYLALAPLLILVICVLAARLRRHHRMLVTAAAVGFIALSAARNRDYRNDVAIWGDAAAKRPGNAWARSNYGAALYRANRPAAALTEYAEAQRRRPDMPETYYNAANALIDLGRTDEAAGHFRAALELRPNYRDAHNNLGNLLMQLGRLPEAIKHYRSVVGIDPDSPEAHYNLGNALFKAGRGREAIGHLQKALVLNPRYVEAAYNLATAYLKEDRLPEALTAFENVLRLQPRHSQAHNNLGNVLAQIGSYREALDHYAAAIDADPDNAEACNNRGVILRHLGRIPEARAAFEAALRLRPDYTQARENLAGLPPFP